MLNYLQNDINAENDVQMIITSHSPNITSKVYLENIIILSLNNAYPLASKFTQLDKSDYLFLERHLDATKANLFFARSLIMIEGESEMVLLPNLFKWIIEKKTKSNKKIKTKVFENFGVSLFKVGSLAHKRYERIFKRKPINSDKPLDYQTIGTKIAVVVDSDETEVSKIVDVKEEYEKEINSPDNKIKAFVSPSRTLEICILESGLKKYYIKAIYKANDMLMKLKKVETIDANIKNKQNEEIYDYIFNTYKFSKPLIIQLFVEEVDHAIEEEKIDIKSIVEAATSLSYLREAINHVCFR